MWNFLEDHKGPKWKFVFKWEWSSVVYSKRWTTVRREVGHVVLSPPLVLKKRGIGFSLVVCEDGGQVRDDAVSNGEGRVKSSTDGHRGCTILRSKPCWRLLSILLPSLLLFFEPPIVRGDQNDMREGWKRWVTTAAPISLFASLALSGWIIVVSLSSRLPPWIGWRWG